MHCVHLPDLDPHARELVIEGPERDHAVQAKRVRAGERLLALSGAGIGLLCEVVEAKRALSLKVLERLDLPPAAPRVEVWSATPKGPRAGDLIDMLSQAGCALWRPLSSERAVAEVRAAKAQRLERVAVEAMKQSRRGWLMEIGAPASFDEAMAPAPGVRTVLAHDDAPSYHARAADEPVRLLIGPEGGWSERELTLARGAGVEACSLGAHVMRIEVAAAVGVGVVIACAGLRGSAQAP